MLRRGGVRVTRPHIVLQVVFILAMGFVLGVSAIPAPASAITWGSPDGDAHPYVGAIVLDYGGGMQSEFCSGALVSPHVFLTAGHCADFLATYPSVWQYYFVSFATNVYSVKADRRVFVDVIPNPDYHWGPVSDPHDTGVLILRDPVENLGYTTLAPPGYLDALRASGAIRETRFINVGYGATEDSYPTGYRMASTSSYQNLHKAWLYLDGNIHTGSGGTCWGDSGGPTFVVDEATGVPYQVSTVSTGDAQCKATNIVYRADIPSTYEFVRAIVAEYDPGFAMP